MSNLPSTTVHGGDFESSMLMNPVVFEQAVRVANMLAVSPLFPQHLRPNKEAGVANGVLVLNMASRLKEDVLTVAQNIYFVGGRPGWAATYMIAKANQTGVFENPIDWKIEGEKADLRVTAFARLKRTGKDVSVTVGMDMARAENWTKNPKYQSMPEQMLRYRSATFLIRLYCPEVMVGVPSVQEVEDEEAMKDVTPAAAGIFDKAKPKPVPKAPPKPAPQPEVEIAEVVEPTVQAKDPAPVTTAPATDVIEQVNMAFGATDPTSAALPAISKAQKGIFDLIMRAVEEAQDLDQLNDDYANSFSDELERLSMECPEHFDLIEKAVSARRAAFAGIEA